MDETVRQRIAELIDLGVTLCDQGNLSGAEELFGGLWAVTQDDVRIASRLGVLRATRGAYAEALEPLARAVALDPSQAIVHSVLSACACETGDYARALVHADAALARDPRLAEAHNSRGNALHRLGREAEAEVAFRKALRLDPKDASAYANLANALRNLGRQPEALASIDKALALDPSLATAHVNRGNVLQDLGRHAEALESYDRALALSPDAEDANWNRALCQLLVGDYAAGWRGYEWRWRRDSPDNRPRNFTTPLWLGQEPLAGRSILLHGEQGFGDCLQFARYVPQVAALGARVILEVYAPLAELFRTIEGVEHLVRGAPVPATDFQTPLMSLPLALGETGPPRPVQPYLSAPRASRALWADRLADGGPIKIGVVATGRAAPGNERRSLPFALLSRHLPPGPAYHLLQKDIAPGDLPALAARPDVTVWQDQLASFADTAALAERMDLIVSIDTSVAHMAGAMGRPLWLLLRYDADWRWGLRSETTPWYPSAKLYRQDARDDWTGVLSRVANDLAARVG